ncbi:2OG-Fe(II) oxygenase [Paraburkholderia caledonica]|uniref:Prolyl 4-hydroxylase alpha subunit Fe(2+) 2OG dioxygenase domain-containing protein n=1 Tax=Paraburkholderia caledonica TaxID=134536 RepID=A0AB73IN80_9BURK|nr:hypothetical protein [Paraburkholderia caledonica]
MKSFEFNEREEFFMRKILRFDDQLSGDVASSLLSFFESVPFQYGWQSGKDAAFNHWNRGFADVHPDNQEDIEHLLRTSTEHIQPVMAAWKSLKAGLLYGHTLVRCYANAHTYGVEGYPHFDSRTRDNFTTIVYVNRNWAAEWAGETVFLNDSGDIIYSILPKPARIVTFPGDLLHCARAVSRSCPTARMTLIFKTKSGAKNGTE